MHRLSRSDLWPDHHHLLDREREAKITIREALAYADAEHHGVYRFIASERQFAERVGERCGSHIGIGGG